MQHMFPSAYDFHEYYLSPSGQAVSALLTRRLGQWWSVRDLAHRTLCGLGYTLPFLAGFKGAQTQCVALLPASIGPLGWPGTGQNQTTVVCRTALPLPDNSVDRVLLVHELEFAEDPTGVLLEAWRVLKPDGKLIVILPNRHGLWARSETTPFGHGRPYTLQQARSLLHDARFSVERHTGVLLVPPLQGGGFGRLMARLLDPLASHVPAFAGLIMVEAGKKLYAPIPVKPLRQGVRGWQVSAAAKPMPAGRTGLLDRAGAE